MKHYSKRLLVPLVISFAFSLAGCANKAEISATESPTVSPSPSFQPTEESTPYPVTEEYAFIEYLTIDEESVTSLLNQYREVLVFNYGVEEDTGDRITDENGNYFYHVTNFSSVEEVLDHLSAFSKEDYANNTLFQYCFKEQDGKLYHGQPTMGITSYRENPDWEYLSDISVKVPFETADGIVTDNMYYEITFTMEEGNWLIESCTLITE